MPVVRTHAGAERGAILPLFAIFLPVIVLFAAFVLEAGNWFVHQRHLQTQVDAAVLAGGSVWAFPCTQGTGSVEESIVNTARNYGGPDSTDPSALYNAQIGGTPSSQLHMLLNSKDYWNQGAVWGDYTDGRPCETKFLDAKATEASLPFLIPFAGSIVPHITAHARVQIAQGSTFGGAELVPFFVRDVNPTSAAAFFIDDATHTVLDAQYMEKLDASLCTTGLQCWTSLNDPSTFAIHQQTSLVVALSSYDQCDRVPAGRPCLALPAAGSSADTSCQQSGVECYGADSSSNLQTGIAFIRGYTPSNNGSPPTPPKLQDVQLAGAGAPGATCPDGYFDYVSSDCTVFVKAKVDVGTFDTANVHIRANGQDLNFDSSDGYWKGTITVTARSDPPGQPLTLRWSEINTTLTGYGTCATAPGRFWNGSNNCRDTFETGSTVQRVYAGQDQFSGPIRAATIRIASTGVQSPGSYPVGSTQTLAAAVALAGGTATSVSDPPVQLRVVVNGGGGNQIAVQCGDQPQDNFRTELTIGCFRGYNPLGNRIDYTTNPRLGTANPCAIYTAPQFFGNTAPYPYDCVPPNTGNVMQQFGDGLAGRILNKRTVCTGSACPTSCPAKVPGTFVPGPNYWSDGGGAFGFPSFNKGDPRIFIVFMVPFGAFRGTGSSTLVPIVHFGAFYVTGWGGQGHLNDDPCEPPGTNPPDGFVVGHFISYVDPSNFHGGEIPCDPSGTTPCVAVLTQ